MDSISTIFMCAYYIEVFLHVIDTTLKCVSIWKYEVFDLSLSLICLLILERCEYDICDSLL